MESELNICTKAGAYTLGNAFFLGAILTPLLLCTTAYSLPSRAELPTFYGQQFVREGKSWPDGRPPVAVPVLSENVQVPKQEYQRQLNEFELMGGPYADNLAEPLLGLGRYYTSEGDYEGAVRFYRRALHIVRLNDGLYSERQAPVVRELLNAVRIAGDFQSLDDRYDYFFRLYGNGEPPYTELRMRASIEYLRWQREALRLGFDGGEKKRLLNLYTLNEDLLAATRATGSYDQGAQWDLTLSQVRNLYLLQSRVTPRVVISGGTSRSPFYSTSAQGNDMDFDQQRLEAIQHNVLSRGRAVLEQYAAAETVIEHKARAMVELGDWYQWYGSYRQARGYYEAAFTMLDEAGEGKLLQAWFGSPVELPDNGAFWQPERLQRGDSYNVVEATFDVSPTGRVKNISVATPDAGVDANVTRFRRELAATRFRPQYESGEAVAVEGLARKYELYD